MTTKTEAVAGKERDFAREREPATPANTERADRLERGWLKAEVKLAELAGQAALLVEALRSNLLPFELSTADRRFNEGLRTAINIVQAATPPAPATQAAERGMVDPDWLSEEIASIWEELDQPHEWPGSIALAERLAPRLSKQVEAPAPDACEVPSGNMALRSRIASSQAAPASDSQSAPAEGRWGEEYERALSLIEGAKALPATPDDRQELVKARERLLSYRNLKGEAVEINGWFLADLETVCVSHLPSPATPDDRQELVENFGGRIPENGLVSIPEKLYHRVLAALSAIPAPAAVGQRLTYKELIA